jgi:hypothetical protein
MVSTPLTSSTPSFKKVLFVLLLSLAMVLAALPLSIRSAQACQGEVTRCSTSFDGVGGNGASERGNISANGRYVVFASAASNLVSGDTNGKLDIFRKDLQTGSIAICSISSLGQANGDSYRPSASGDGRYVAFDSYATNLVTGDTNNVRDVFVKDMETLTVKRCSTSATLVEGNGTSIEPFITPDGRYVCFYSSSSNLVTGDTNNKDDVFLKDTQTDGITRCSVDSSGNEGNGGSSFPACTPDGRYVVFQSLATDLVSGDYNGKYDVFRKDMVTKAISMLSTSSSNIQGNDASYAPVISDDGRYVSFVSLAYNLVAGDANDGSYDVFRKDMQTSGITCCSTSSTGVKGDGLSGSYSSISSDGRYVLFCNNSTNLVPGDSNSNYDVFRKDLGNQKLIRCSTSSSDGEGNGSSKITSFSMSADGRKCTFYSPASNLVSGDINGVSDVFLKDLSPPAISSISPNSGATGTEVTIKGSRFGPNRVSSYVTFGGKKATTYTAWSDTQIKALVPSGAAGSVNVKVTTELGTSNTKPFTVKDVPAYYFAEGCTREGFDTYLCLQNPNSSAVNVAITYMISGEGTRDQQVTLEKNSRKTIVVNSVVGPGKDVSIKVVPQEDFIVAERPIYFNYAGRWDGGHCVVGTTSPEKTLYFAEGYTGNGFDTYLCLQNPNSNQASVTITYMFPGGGTQDQQETLSPRSRKTISVNGAVGSDRDVSIKISSSLPIVAERPMYFNYQGWDGGHCVLGTPAPDTALYFAEGYTGSGFDTYLCLQNPNSSAAAVTITYMFGGGGTQDQQVTLDPRSRKTVLVDEAVGPDKDVSAKITSSLPIVAERPMYFNYGGWKGGSAVMGATSPSTSWYFAEGYTGNGFEEYLTLQNPGNARATATVTYLLEGGGTVPKQHDILAHSRLTVPVHSDLGRGFSHSTLITSDKPIICERPMYFVYGFGLGPGALNWDGGHCVMGYGR